MGETRKIAAILVSDVVGYSRLAGADEDDILARLRTLRSSLIDPTIAAHNGRVVKRSGDGSLVEFRSVVDAVRCAIDVQKAMIERNAGVAPDRQIVFRIGIHLGDVVEESDGDLMGDAVNIAARLEGVTQPGAICLSEDAYRQVKARLDLLVTDLGPVQLKNISEPIRVYELHVGVAGQVKPTEAAVSSAVELRSVPSSAADKPSIAVLAFNNMSGDAEQEYFSDGISEDIITDLSKISGLHVIARNSSFVYKQSAVSIPDVATALGVRHVLEGSVRKVGNRVRVTAQLIDAMSGGHVWASRFDRDLTDIFAVQDEITQEIVAALKLNLTLGEHDRLAKMHAVNLQAYEFFLRSRDQALASTPASNIEARSLAKSAIAREPEYAAAYALIAFTHVIDYVNGWGDDPEQALRIGLELAEKAVAMEPDQPIAHFPFGMACMWNQQLERARADMQRAIELSPNSVEMWLLKSHLELYSGNPTASLQALDVAMRLDPHYPEVLLQFVADARFSLGQYAEVISTLERRLVRNPQSETANALLASCYGHLGQFEESRRAWERALQINPGFSLERRRRVLPFKNPEDFESRVDGLRKAGLVA